jgi:GTPase SAR1 family protein
MDDLEGPEDPHLYKERSLGGAVKAAFIGTAKAGKSTLINSLLGAEFLPVGAACETVAVVLIQDSDSKEHKDGVLYTFDERNANGGTGTELARGAVDINAKLQAINRSLRDQAPAVAAAEEAHLASRAYTLEDGTQLPVRVPQLVLKVKFPASLTGGVRFDMFDTPGPNEAELGVHRMVGFNARQVLKNADVVVLVVNFTTMGTREEDDLLR